MDLDCDHLRTISQETAMSWAFENDMEYIETSSKDDLMVQDMLMKLIDLMVAEAENCSSGDDTAHVDVDFEEKAPTRGSTCSLM